jgi:hypothetical protein
MVVVVRLGSNRKTSQRRLTDSDDPAADFAKWPHPHPLHFLVPGFEFLLCLVQSFGDAIVRRRCKVRACVDRPAPLGVSVYLFVDAPDRLVPIQDDRRAGVTFIRSQRTRRRCCRSCPQTETPPGPEAQTAPHVGYALSQRRWISHSASRP